MSQFQLNPDSLINQVNKKHIPSPLRPFEIKKYELEKSFEFTNFTNEELIKDGEEQLILSIADYYFIKAKKLNRHYKLAKPYLEKAIELYEALENMANIYQKETYVDRKVKALNLFE